MLDVSNVVRRERRELVGVRLGPSLEDIDRIAADNEWTRSQVIRKLLAIGLEQWKKGRR